MAKMGRPKKEINWKIVEAKMSAGCSAEEIYNDPDTMMDKGTFYDRFNEEYGESFSTYSHKLHSNGKGNIRFMQYQKAMKGNTTLLILLGKHWLGQKEQENITQISDEAFMNIHRGLIDKLNESHSERKIDDNNIINDS